jgi:PIN domain nuclease of toxin-antitoxin system
MKVLLDTHTFIWWDSDPAKLSPKALALCQNPATTVLLSVASVWEMQIKVHLGKLKLKLPLADIVNAQQRTNGVEVVPVNLPHVLELDSLPAPHKDPFDRLLVAQANVEQATLITVDPIFSQYPVSVLW